VIAWVPKRVTPLQDLHERWRVIRVVSHIVAGRCILHRQAFGDKEAPAQFLQILVEKPSAQVEHE
jgi:hypothetical protein